MLLLVVVEAEVGEGRCKMEGEGEETNISVQPNHHVGDLEFSTRTRLLLL